MSFAEQKFKLLQRLNNSNYLIIYFDSFSMFNSVLVDLSTLEISPITPLTSNLFGLTENLLALDVASVETLVSGLSDVVVDMHLITETYLSVLIQSIHDLKLTMNTRSALAIYINTITSKITMSGTFLANLEFDALMLLAMNSTITATPTTGLAVETITNMLSSFSMSSEFSFAEEIAMAATIPNILNWSVLMTFMFYMSLLLPMSGTSQLNGVLAQLDPTLSTMTTVSTLQISSLMGLIIANILAIHDPKQLSTLDTLTLLELEESIN